MPIEQLRWEAQEATDKLQESEAPDNPTDKLQKAIVRAARFVRYLPSVKVDINTSARVDMLIWLIGIMCTDADDKFDSAQFYRSCGMKP